MDTFMVTFLLSKGYKKYQIQTARKIIIKILTIGCKLFETDVHSVCKYIEFEFTLLYCIVEVCKSLTLTLSLTTTMNS